MALVGLTATADEDIAEIFDYLAQRGGQRTVQKYQRRFDEVFDRLQAFPRSGHPRPKLEARVVVVPPYLIIYDFDAASDKVTIMRILRGERKLTRSLVRT